MSPSGVVIYRVKFFGENYLCAKITKNGGLELFYTIGLLDLVKNGGKKR